VLGVLLTFCRKEYGDHLIEIAYSRGAEGTEAINEVREELNEVKSQNSQMQTDVTNLAEKVNAMEQMNKLQSQRQQVELEQERAASTDEHDKDTITKAARDGNDGKENRNQTEATTTQPVDSRYEDQRSRMKFHDKKNYFQNLNLIHDDTETPLKRKSPVKQENFLRRLSRQLTSRKPSQSKKT